MIILCVYSFDYKKTYEKFQDDEINWNIWK